MGEYVAGTWNMIAADTHPSRSPVPHSSLFSFIPTWNLLLLWYEVHDVEPFVLVFYTEVKKCPLSRLPSALFFWIRNEIVSGEMKISCLLGEVDRSLIIVSIFFLSYLWDMFDHENNIYLSPDFRVTFYYLVGNKMKDICFKVCFT